MMNSTWKPPTIALIFNDRSAAGQVQELIERDHAFARYESIEAEDEQGRAAWVLAIWCETATANQIYDSVVPRLPDYIRARWFPPTRVRELVSS